MLLVVAVAVSTLVAVVQKERMKNGFRVGGGVLSSCKAKAIKQQSKKGNATKQRAAHSRAEGRALLLPVGRDDEVPDPADLLGEVSLAEEGLGEGVLDGAVDVVHEHVGGAFAGPPRARRHAGGVDGAHPPRGLRRPPRRRVHHDEVPLEVVEHRRQALEGEAAGRLGGGGEVRLRDAGRVVAELEERVGLGEDGVVGDVVGLERRVLGADVGDPRRVLLEEHGAAAVVERRPHGAVEPEPEDEEVAGRPTLQHAERHPDLVRGLLRRHVRGRVVHQSLRHRQRQPLALTAAFRRLLPPGRRRGRRGEGARGEDEEEAGQRRGEEEAQREAALPLREPGAQGREVDRLADVHGARHGRTPPPRCR
ncbi:hypothetical protein SEVIR_7G285701v4 [Setaria viridis]